MPDPTLIKPAHARAFASGRARLEALKQELAAGGASFSSLPPTATLLAEAHGVRPLATVMGSSVYQISLRSSWLIMFGFTRPTMEMAAYVEALLELRRHAFDRLKSEAAILGADGVIDVKITQDVLPSGAIEFKAFGTAVKLDEPPPAARKAPFTSDLSGPQFVKLREAGGWPVDAVYGISIHWVKGSDSRPPRISGWWSNAEVPAMSEALRHARRDAMARMRKQAHARGGTHVVGADVWTQVLPVPRFWGMPDLLVVYFARGTAVDMRHKPPDHAPAKPLLFLDLATGASSSLTGLD